MTGKVRKVLKIIADKALETCDSYVISVAILVKNSDEAKTIRDELVESGCISKAEIFGHYYIRCRFESVAFKYLK